MAMDVKYKHTQKLLKIAIAEGGYTNVEIAKKAGLKESSGSLVSRWRNGKALATERQMQYFINEYGGHLKRKNTHLFYSRNFNTDNKDHEFSYHKIEGEELFSHKISSALKVKASNESIRAFKVVVIQVEQGYVLVKLLRAGLFKFEQQEDKKAIINYVPAKADWLHGDAENSNWFAEEVIECSSFDNLVAEFQSFMQSLYSANGFLVAEFQSYRQSIGIIGPAVPLCSILDTEPVSFSFYHKCLKLGLQSEHLPF